MQQFDSGSGDVPRHRICKCCRYCRCPPLAYATIGCIVCKYCLCNRPARFGPEFDADRYAGRSNRDGRVPQFTLSAWLRRLITRLIAIIPAVIVTSLYGERGTGQLLVFSQVILSMQLSFAVVPLVMFTNDALKMGKFVNPRWLSILAWTIAVVIMTLNIYLIVTFFFS